MCELRILSRAGGANIVTSVLDRFDLTGRVALITGASGGIGRAIAEALAQAGALVFVGGRTAATLATLIDQINANGGRAAEWLLDMNDLAGLQEGIDDIARQAGRIDILVNCAGMIARSSLAECRDDAWQEVLDVNLTAPFQLSRAVAPHMAAQRWGRIVNVGSALSVQGKANAIAYVASKHGIAGLTRALAAELGSSGICANALCPGYVRTEINRSLQNDPSYSDKIEAATPLGRWAVPADMTGPALFLCSEAASYVNGHLLVVDGGMTQTH